MLVNLEPFGRLGNRLFLAAHLSAFCWKHKVEFFNPALAPYDRLFPALAPFTYWQERLVWVARSWLPGAVRFFYWGDRELNFDQERIPQLEHPLQEGKTVFFRAWLFRGYESVSSFRERIVERFRPHPSVVDSASNFATYAKSRGDLLVGVHLRWADYRGTKHFLSLAEYLAGMQSVCQLFKPHKVVFLVFSNEPLPHSDFSKFTAVFPNGSAIQDMTLMAQCDYLMAPPSTFSSWASFYGKVPLWSLEQGGAKPTESDFRVYRG